MAIAVVYCSGPYGVSFGFFLLWWQREGEWVNEERYWMSLVRSLFFTLFTHSLSLSFLFLYCCSDGRAKVYHIFRWGHNCASHARPCGRKAKQSKSKQGKQNAPVGATDSFLFMRWYQVMNYFARWEVSVDSNSCLGVLSGRYICVWVNVVTTTSAISHFVQNAGSLFFFFFFLLQKGRHDLALIRPLFLSLPFLPFFLFLSHISSVMHARNSDDNKQIIHTDLFFCCLIEKSRRK